MPSTTSPLATETPRQELMSALSTLLEAGKYSDLTIVCGQKKYAVHRAIICSRSGFFDGAVSSPFRESQTGVIDLSEDDPTAVEHMVHYFYHLDYLAPPQSRSRRMTSRSSPPHSRPTSPTASASSPVIFSPTLGGFRKPARKINLALVEDPLLATAAANASNAYNAPTPPVEAPSGSKTVSAPDSAIDLSGNEGNPFENITVPDTAGLDVQPTEEPFLLTHVAVYTIADKYHIAGLKALASAKFQCQLQQHWKSEEFAEALMEVYENSVETDRGLRDCCLQAFREHREIVSQPKIQEVTKETPGLAWELFRVVSGMPIS